MTMDKRPPCIECKNYVGIDTDIDEHICSIPWERYDFVTGKMETGNYTQMCKSRRGTYLAVAEDCWERRKNAT
jgi:hypothetical protein